MAKCEYMQNRELSWLVFNERVLSEAMDQSVPLFERLKFIAIFTSNLDEFFMVRVGSLYDLSAFHKNSVDSRTGWTAKEQLEAIYDRMPDLYEQRETAYEAVDQKLKEAGVQRVRYDELSRDDRRFCNDCFKSRIEPILSPQIVDTYHPFPFFKNKTLHIGVWLKYKSREMFGVIPMPDTLPAIIMLPGQHIRYIQTEEIVLAHVEEVFSNYTVLEKTIFCITRNAEVDLEAEDLTTDGEDFRKQMKRVLKKRGRMMPVRLELSNKVKEDFTSYLKNKLSITDKQIIVTSAPLDLKYVYSLEDKLSDEQKTRLLYTPFSPCLPADFNPRESVVKQVTRKDRVLSYPFESMEPFLDLVKEASEDKNTISIKITIYRLAKKTKLVDYLCAAAENGIDVVVFIELKARFDEENNINWSERLEDAGCTVYYGFKDYKIHSKICLITRKDRGKIRYITQIGTGNYNEKTVKQYTDVSIITADMGIGTDAVEFFKNMAIGNLEGDYKELLVAPVSLKKRLIELIERETAKKGAGRIIIKVNSITDVDIIEKLKEASQAGVKIDMIVRGICCILPHVPGYTDNIHVMSIVGRYLEHSRIYCFGTGGNERMFISSADFMTRNTQRRVEMACPVYDPDVKEKLHYILSTCLSDNVKGRDLTSSGTYIKRSQTPPLIDSQKEMMKRAVSEAGNKRNRQEKSKSLRNLVRIFSGKRR